MKGKEFFYVVSVVNVLDRKNIFRIMNECILERSYLYVVIVVSVLFRNIN